MNWSRKVASSPLSRFACALACAFVVAAGCTESCDPVNDDDDVAREIVREQDEGGGAAPSTLVIDSAQCPADSPVACGERCCPAGSACDDDGTACGIAAPQDPRCPASTTSCGAGCCTAGNVCVDGGCVANVCIECDGRCCTEAGTCNDDDSGNGTRVCTAGTPADPAPLPECPPFSSQSCGAPSCEGTCTLVDSSGNGRDAFTISGRYTPGVSDTGLLWPGSPGVFGCAADGLSQGAQLISDPSTIEAWVRTGSTLTAALVDGERRLAIRISEGGGAGVSVRLSAENDAIGCEGAAPFEGGELSAAYHYFAATVDAGVVNVFADGARIATCPMVVPNVPAEFFGLNCSAQAFPDVRVDEVRVQNVALSEEQIAASFADVVLAVDANTVALWHFDEGTATCCPNDAVCAADGASCEAPEIPVACGDGYEAGACGCCPFGTICDEGASPSCLVDDIGGGPDLFPVCGDAFNVVCGDGCCAQGYVCTEDFSCLPVEQPPPSPEVCGEPCGVDECCPAVPADLVCAVPGERCCPADFNVICGDNCCPAGSACDEAGTGCGVAPGGCDDADFPVECGARCCATGIECRDAQCLCPSTHPDPCANVCCLDGAECVDGECTCPVNRATCGDRCCGEGQACVAGVCTDENAPSLCAPGELHASRAACNALQPGDPCECSLAEDTDACIADSEFTERGFEPADVCTAEGETGCFTRDPVNFLVRPCCPGLTCMITPECGDVDPNGNGTCLAR